MITEDLGSWRSRPQLLPTQPNTSSGLNGPSGSVRPTNAGQRREQIVEMVELIRSGRSVVVAAEVGSGRTTVLREVLGALRRPALMVSASESARSIPLGAFAGLLTLQHGMSPTERVVGAVDRFRSDDAVVAVDDADLLDDESATVLLALAMVRPVVLTVNNNASAPDAINRITRDHASVFSVSRLDHKEMLDVAERCLGGFLDPDSLMRLCEGIDGNPGRLLDRIARARQEGTLQGHEGVWSYGGRTPRPLGERRRRHIWLVDDIWSYEPGSRIFADAGVALRRGEPEVAARHLAPFVSAHQYGVPGHVQGLVAAQLRWALAWSGRAVAENRQAIVPIEVCAESELASACAEAELGDDVSARDAALAVAESPDTTTATLIDALHLAGRLDPAGSLVRRIAAIIDSASGDASRPVMEAQLAHVRGLDRKDAGELERAAACFRQLGYLAFAHESISQAAIVYQLNGTPRQAGRCRVEAETLAQGGVRPTFAARRASGQLPLLTRRERAVVGLVANGRTLRQVATELGCAPRTAESHLQHAYVKLGVNDRASLRSVIAGA